MPAPPPAPRDLGRTARLVLISLSLVLLLINVGVWAGMRRFVRQQETALDHRLVSLGGFAISGFDPVDYYFPFATAYDPVTRATSLERLRRYSSLPAFSRLRLVLEKLLQSGELTSAEILSPQGILLLTKDGLPDSEALPENVRQDLSFVSQARRAGLALTTPTPGEPSKRCYFAMRYEDDVVAILRLEVDRSYFLEFRRDLTRLGLLTLLASVLLLALWLASMRLTRRTIMAERIANQSDRLRALGTLTAGVAHELRNPLNILSLTAEDAAGTVRALPEGASRTALEESFKGIREEVRRLARLTDQFLDFSRLDPVNNAGHADATVAVDQVVRRFSVGLRDQAVTLQWQAPAAPHYVCCNEARLQQVLVNLLDNARKALETTRTPGARIDVTLSTERARVFIRIQDNGPGMDPATLAQVFDPFFTTHHDGTGLGLPLSRGIVESVGGRLLLESAPGKGTTAVVELQGLESPPGT